MKTIVIGAGLIGLTSAWYLHRCGDEVEVIDRELGPGLGTSFANGGLLTPSMSDPWNTPGSWRILIASIGRSNSAMQLRLKALPSLIGWGIQFLRNSSIDAYERNTRANLRLAMHSLAALKTLQRETGIEFAHAAPGTLRLFRDPRALEVAEVTSARILEGQLSLRTLGATETVALEPALAPIADRLAGAIYYEGDETGDAHRFCVGLADVLRQRGVEFRFGTSVTALEGRGGELDAIACGRERLRADRYVLATGSLSAPLVRSIGLSLLVRPVKGYSLSVEHWTAKHRMRIPVVDDHLHAAITPIGSALRVAGTAEFTGYDLSLDSRRVENLRRLLREILPEAQFDATAVRPWCGLRPTSADGVPVIGASPFSNLWLNCGHGHLGWTMAAGSAQLLVDIMHAKRPAIDPAPYAAARDVL